VIKALHKAAEVMKTYYNENRDQAPPLTIGQKVWLEGTNITPVRPMKKLADKQHGPFKILEVIGPSSYKLKIPKAWKGIHPVFNEVLLQPYKEPLPSQSKPPPPNPVQIDEQEEYEVESILDSKKVHNLTQYLVHWKGYGPEDNTWEPKLNLAHAKKAIEDYENQSIRRLLLSGLCDAS